MIYLHVGAGPADLDKRTHGRCGFTEYIKKNYKHYDNVKIFNLGISNSSYSYLEFYYSHVDKPHYPTCSLKYEHVKNIILTQKYQNLELRQ